MTQQNPTSALMSQPLSEVDPLFSKGFVSFESLLRAGGFAADVAGSLLPDRLLQVGQHIEARGLVYRCTYLNEGKGATVTARFGSDGITIVDPNRAAEGVDAVFQRIYEGAV